MGEIRDKFWSAFRDFNVPGVPASGRAEPAKAEIRDLALSIEAGIAAAALSGTDLDAALDLIQPLVASAQAAQSAAEYATELLSGFDARIDQEVADAVNDVLAMAADQPAFAALIAEGMAQRVAIDARAALYGISAASASRFSSASTEASFSEAYYRAGYARAANVSGLPWAYARAGAATAPTSGGLLRMFGADVPRITDAGLRIEPASSNTARPGNDFTSALWTKTGVVLAVGGAGPLGSMTRVTANSAGYHFVGQVMDSVGTVSVYARGAGIRRVGIQIQTGAGTKRVVYDLLTGGVISADAGVTAWMDPGPVGTYRLVATVANGGAATVRIHALADDSSDAFPADGSKSFEMSAVQSEPGAIVTSYIDTVDVPASRGLDTASFAFAPFGDFTIFAEAELRRSEGLEGTIVSLIGTSPANRVALLRDTSGRLAVEVVNEGTAARTTGPIKGAGTVRVAVTVRGSQVIAAIDGETVLTLAATRPPNLQTLWLGIRGTVEAALNGTLRRVLTAPFALTQDELIDMTGIPRSLTASEGAGTNEVREMLIAHANDRQVHGLTATNRLAAEADSKTGIWTVAATDTFTGTDGTPLGSTETGGFTWVNPGNFQRVGGRAKQPANAFGGAAIDTTFTDGQIEADLYPGTGEASLVFRSNTNFNQYFLLQRGGDGTVRLAYVFTATELLRPLISLPVVAGERWKVRFVGPRIFVYRIVSGVETLIYEASDTRLATNVRHGLRLNGTGAVDNFRLLKREAL